MSAIMSPCGSYRYLLARQGHLLGVSTLPLLFVMLNPSTADAEKDDPTIRRCRGFAERLGYNGIRVINLYGLRATNPNDLWKHPDPVGPRNDSIIGAALWEHGMAVCAWGVNAKPERVQSFLKLAAQYDTDLRCLGVTASGAPRHPLYVRGDQQLIPWRVA